MTGAVAAYTRDANSAAQFTQKKTSVHGRLFTARKWLLWKKLIEKFVIYFSVRITIV